MVACCFKKVRVFKNRGGGRHEGKKSKVRTSLVHNSCDVKYFISLEVDPKFSFALKKKIQGFTQPIFKKKKKKNQTS